MDAFMNRFDANFSDDVTAAEIERRLVQEGADASTASFIAKQAMANWDKSKTGALSLEEVRAMAETWAAYPGDASVSAFAVQPGYGDDK